MIEVIVHDLEPVVLVGGGDATPQDLAEGLTLAHRCVAADGGAALALAQGVELAAVIGDFDSLPPRMRADIPLERQHPVQEQDSTDFEKCLARIEAPVVIGVGFCGARVDHQLAALHALARFAHKPCVLMGETELIFLAPRRMRLPTRAGDVISLFPLGPVSGRSTGLAWPIDGLAFDPLQKIGTSNAATGPCVLEIDDPCMIAMVPRRLIQPVVSQLQQAPSLRWPARA